MKFVNTMWFKVLLLALIILAFGLALFVFDIRQFLTLEYFRSVAEPIKSFVNSKPILSAAIFFMLYFVMAASSIPGLVILTLASGFLFGFIKGSILVSFASSLGATVAFLVVRFFLKDFVQSKFSKQIDIINEGVNREGSFYLFTMRVIPLFPFILVNALMALTPMRVPKYYITTQLGMLPGTLIFVNAGLQLQNVKSPSDILTFNIILSFVLIGVVPIILKKGIERFRKGQTT